ncbi:ATP-binding protein [Okeania sp. SIO1I7]|uniref:NACHT C-terminal helical domain 2-containing protein n=1 Tax=Okeania sp. SIO1I7 TaxID=2607772 RepID=UPI0013F6D52E|nr:ATP-binding protein [Okeania sp. SIO1I7]NET26353.1 AAA family ATPase [Okeania sp. SIO1I7]
MMNEQEALEIVNEAIFQKEGRKLKDIEELIFIGAFQNLTYGKIAENNDYDEQHIKNKGADFWKLLSEALGEKVSKNNFLGALERRQDCSAKLPLSLSSNNSLFQELTTEINVPKKPDFVGREEAFAHLNTLITGRGAKVIGIYGKGGIGKTTLAREYLQVQRIKILELNVGMDTEYITSVKSWVKRQINQQFKQKAKKKFIDMLEQLKYLLQNEEEKVVILIDNLETALDEKGKFKQEHRDYIELITRVLNHPTVNAITLITCREEINEAKLSFVESYPLPELSELAWREFFSIFEININTLALSEIHKAYGGNALVMKVITHPIETYYGGSLEDYWLDNKQFLLKGQIKDLIASQFDRLFEHDRHAYNLLCRLGIYPYQEIPRVQKIGLFCLLWDVKESENMQVIESLQRRYLIEFEAGKYWLHPVIRAESLTRLDALDNTLLLMKEEIDKLLVRDEKFQHFLEWLREVTLLDSDFTPLDFRAFYLCLEYVYSFGIFAQDEFLELANFFGIPSMEEIGEVFFNFITSTDVSKIEEEMKVVYEIHEYLLYDLLIDKRLYDILKLGRCSSFDPKNYLASEIDYLTGDGQYIDLELKQALQTLKSELPDPNQKEELFDAWWKTNSKNWAEKLRKVMIEYCNIGHDWQFNRYDYLLLEEYYHANVLLLYCLYYCDYHLTDSVRNKIKDELFLPIAEIEKRKE